jgi:hypothetical protein
MRVFYGFVLTVTDASKAADVDRMVPGTETGSFQGVQRSRNLPPLLPDNGNRHSFQRGK